ncbi:hypothetical protein GSI_14399 [Ganoderma sinense ZZ0214-1]|uniref:GST C-terminal domain-containing protein n=1 Tax=Ganoderma sinense ZZ0214-1 TaxID=1077348 RepID=A0A2G8RNL2_9APHY|nr:hypothetical protein GSI_14399 [Ganoderma sinense ZZ0214-1]
MLVCRHWRDVGISTPWLWRRISITQNKESLRYRLSQPGECTIDENSVVNDSAMADFIPLAPRIRSLQTPNCFPFESLPSIRPLFEVPFPALEYVKVPYIDFARPQPGDRFDLGLSGDLLPRLRELEIDLLAVSLVPPPAVFSMLKDLVINFKGPVATPLHAKNVLNILAHAPRLHTLKIMSADNHQRGLLSEADVQPDGEPRTCRLPHLEKLVLKCSYQDVAAILRGVDAPNLAAYAVKAISRTPVTTTEIGARFFPPPVRNIVRRFPEIHVFPSPVIHPPAFHIRGSMPPNFSQACHPTGLLNLSFRDRTGSIEPLTAALDTLWSAFSDTGTGTSLESLHITGFKTKIAPSPALWAPLHTTSTFSALSSLISRSPVPPRSSSPSSWLSGPRPFAGRPSSDRPPTLPRAVFEPANSLALHDMFESLVDALLARQERGGASARPVKLSLGLAAKNSAALVVHRWTLNAVSSLCGSFELRTWDTYRFRGQELSELFTLGEPRMLAKSEDSPGPGQSGSATADRVSQDTIHTGDHELELESAERKICDLETGASEDCHSDHWATVTPDAGEHDRGGHVYDDEFSVPTRTMSSTRPEKKQRTEDYVLYYWPGIPGRGEYVRLALEYAGVPYTEQNSPPSGLIPYLADAARLPSGRVVSQTGAILHLIAPRCGLAGAHGSKFNLLTAEGRAALRELSEDELERGEEERAAVTQLVLSALDWQTEAHDIHHPIASALYYEDQKPEAARAAEPFRRDRIPRWLAHFENVLKTNPATAGGERVYLVGKQTTAADLVLFHVVAGVSFAFPRRMGQLKEEGEYANVFALYERVKGEKGIKEYLASGRRQEFSLGIFRHYAELDQEEGK